MRKYVSESCPGIMIGEILNYIFSSNSTMYSLGPAKMSPTGERWAQTSVDKLLIQNKTLKCL